MHIFFALLVSAPAQSSDRCATCGAGTVAADARSAAKDFAAEAKLLFTSVACGAGENTLDKSIVEKHCAELKPMIAGYQEFWKNNIEPTIAKLVPREQATTVVYPFGGGDSLTALGTYPNVTDLTTLSLELVGDPRGINKLNPVDTKAELAAIRKNLELLFRVKHSKTDNMGQMTRGGVSGQLVFALVAEVVRGYEPVALRYFAVMPDGTLDWLTAEEIAAIDEQLAKGTITPRQHAHAFDNMELEFKGADGKTRLYRHIAANLDNEHVVKEPGPIKYLETKGKVFAITKAASYLLWWDNFSSIRQYLVDHMEFMISDSTGVPPDIAKEKGFKQYTFGTFEGAWLPDANAAVSAQFKKLWRAQPSRPIDFRYGYPDSQKNAHMLITTKLAIAGLE